MSYQRLSYVTMVCVAVHFPMILSLMNGFQIRVSITLKDNRVLIAHTMSTRISCAGPLAFEARTWN